MTNTETAVTVIEQSTSDAVVEWQLDDFPADRFNRLIPTQTLMIPTDLLRPVVQIVQLNPDEKAGDVYHSADMPDGHSAPTKVALRKFATAAGISIIDERRVDDGRDPDVIEVSCVAEMLMPTGQRLRAVGSKRVDLNAQVWRSPQHRGKYKSFFQEHVASRAENRAIRALLSLRGSYPTEVYTRPFAVVSFAPNMAHPEVRARILDAMVPAANALYGPGSDQRQLTAGEPIDVTPAPEDDPAPATPTTLPGESLAKAAAGDVPDWAGGTLTTDAAATTEAQKKGGKPKAKTLVERLQESAEVSGMTGEANDAQKAKLRELISGLDWPTEIIPVLVAAFGDEAARSLSAPQAQAILNVADALESADPAIALADAWREAAIAARKAVA